MLVILFMIITIMITMKNIFKLLFITSLISFASCTDNSDGYPIVTRTSLWEIRQVNDTTLMAVPTTGETAKPILFKLKDKETYQEITEE